MNPPQTPKKKPTQKKKNQKPKTEITLLAALKPKTT
jgi:hypothetical protein